MAQKFSPSVLGWAFLTTLVAVTSNAPMGSTGLHVAAAEIKANDVQTLKAIVLDEAQRADARSMVQTNLRRRLQEANDRSSAEWQTIQTVQQWETFKRRRIDLLRSSLGKFPDPPPQLPLHKTGETRGDGFRIENLLFQSRPGLWVTANLYVPEPAVKQKMPGILICHSHHRPKEHGELQDMGMTWARAGCAVLVMDQLGHGERRQHPFATADDFPGEFSVSRQDYYFRYDTSIQLYLAGESLIGWMAWDLMRGVDLLLARRDVDPAKIILLGAVAGGGDPAAVTAAIDPRIAAAVPFNFGGPQPETRFPLPDDVETSFNYAGSGSWESTRNLRHSAGDGFLPWVIVGSIAPRRLIFAHEFSWDQQRDPVWKRLQRIFDLYQVGGNLSYTHGRGELRGRPPEATHCTHIGRFHRQRIHETFRRWFAIEVSANDEYSRPVESSKLACWTPEAAKELQPKKLHELLLESTNEQLTSARAARANVSPDAQRSDLRQTLRQLLGNIDPTTSPAVVSQKIVDRPGGEFDVVQVVLRSEPEILVPVTLLVPKSTEGPLPVIVAVAQDGKAAFLEKAAERIAAALGEGIAICLPDVRGTGETRVGNDRGRYSADTSRAASELMLGGTMVGARLRDLRQVLVWLRQRSDIDPQRIGLWGESFAAPHPENANFSMPRLIDGRPRETEPLGAMLALFGALFEEDVKSVYVGSGLIDFQSVLASQFVYIPLDVVIPGLLTTADLSDLPVRRVATFNQLIQGL